MIVFSLSAVVYGTMGGCVLGEEGRGSETCVRDHRSRKWSSLSLMGGVSGGYVDKLRRQKRHFAVERLRRSLRIKDFRWL